jgi:hypothetical protein
VTLTALLGASLYARISSIVLVVKLVAIGTGLLAFVARSGAGVGECGSGCGDSQMVIRVSFEREGDGDHFEPNFVQIG